MDTKTVSTKEVILVFTGLGQTLEKLVIIDTQGKSLIMHLISNVFKHTWLHEIKAIKN